VPEIIEEEINLEKELKEFKRIERKEKVVISEAIEYAKIILKVCSE